MKWSLIFSFEKVISLKKNFKTRQTSIKQFIYKIVQAQIIEMKIQHVDERFLNLEATCKQAPTTSMELLTKCCVPVGERTGRAVRFKFYSKPLDRWREKWWHTSFHDSPHFFPTSSQEGSSTIKYTNGNRRIKIGNF